MRKQIGIFLASTLPCVLLACFPSEAPPENPPPKRIEVEHRPDGDVLRLQDVSRLDVPRYVYVPTFDELRPATDAEVRARVAAARAALEVLDALASRKHELANDVDTILTRGLLDDVIARGEKALQR